MNFYIFVNSASYDLNDKVVRAPDIFSYRMKNNAFPLYYRTKHKKNLKPDDSIIFYLAGSIVKKTQRFIAYGKIKDIKVDQYYDEEDVHSSLPIEKVVRLKSLVVGKNSVSIYDVKDKLSFVSKKKKWGSSMQGGVIKITEEDFNLLVQEMNK